MKSGPWLLALVLTGPTLTWAEDSLGKLFFSPAQREALDAGKRIFIKRAEQGQAAPAKPRVPDVAVNGVVTRSDGERTVWVNGQAFHNESPDGIRVRTNPNRPASTSISIPQTQKTADVLVGQQLDVVTGRIQNQVSRDPPVEPAPVSGERVSSRSQKPSRSNGEENDPLNGQEENSAVPR